MMEFSSLFAALVQALFRARQIAGFY